MFGIFTILEKQNSHVLKQVVNLSCFPCCFRVYLCQTTLVVLGLVSILFPSIQGNFGHNLYAAIYGFLAGGFNYNLKMHIYEMSKSRHFALMWSCVRGIQSIGVGIGVTTFGMNFENVDVRGFWGGIFLFLAAIILFIGDR